MALNADLTYNNLLYVHLPFVHIAQNNDPHSSFNTFAYIQATILGSSFLVASTLIIVRWSQCTHVCVFVCEGVRECLHFFAIGGVRSDVFLCHKSNDSPRCT